MAEQPFKGSLKPGAKLGKYEVREQLATGGMAILYKAYDPSLDRYVAVKQIAPHLAQDERFLERFRTEAQTLARISSSQANIVTVHELIQEGGQLYLVMEYVEGTTLRVLMDRGPVALQTGLGVLLSTALGLKAMHAQGIVHRDLSPANIMMAKDGALKITDFGLIGHSGGKTSLPMGTTKYMAPEMFTGVPVDARADLYSLGMIAYEMFVGPEKFAEVFRDVLRDERAQQVRWMHWHSNPTLAAPSLRELQPGVPPLVAKITERMMEKDPSKRFASADQVIRWLRRIFVMHVQGKSISLKDSESLEKEMETEAAGAARPAGARSGAARAPAGAAAGGAAAAPAQESGEKTAPLPQVRWTWKRAAFWAAVTAGPLILVAAGLLYWSHSETAKRVRMAQEIQAEGDDLYKKGEYAAADVVFTKMVNDFRDLDSHARYAKEHALRARAENALEKKEWGKADEFAMEAERKYSAEPTWVTSFRKRFSRAQDIEQQMKDAELAQQKGDFTKAIDLLTDLQAKYADLQLNDVISELRDKLELKEYTRLIDDGKANFEKGNLNAARLAFEGAKKIRETPEVNDLLKNLTNKEEVRRLLALAQKAEAAKKPGDARGYYAKILELEPSDDIRKKMNFAGAEELAAQAEELEKNGLVKEANEIWAKVLALNLTHAKAVAALQRAGHQQNLDNCMKAGKTAMGAQQWDQAINSFKEARKLVDPVKEKELLAQIDGQIVEASYQKAKGRSVEALKQKQFEEAERLAIEAQGFKDTEEINGLITQIDTHRRYYGHLDTGKALLRQVSYVKGLASFDAAKKVMDTQEVRDLIADTNYRRYLAQGKSYRDDKRFKEALPVLKMAQRARDTIEVQALIQQIEMMLAAEQNKKK